MFAASHPLPAPGHAAVLGGAGELAPPVRTAAIGTVAVPVVVVIVVAVVVTVVVVAVAAVVALVVVVLGDGDRGDGAQDEGAGDLGAGVVVRIARADAEFRATAARDPDAVAVVAPGVVLPAALAAELAREVDAAGGVHRAGLVLLVLGFADDGGVGGGNLAGGQQQCRAGECVDAMADHVTGLPCVRCGRLRLPAATGSRCGRCRSCRNGRGRHPASRRC